MNKYLLMRLGLPHHRRDERFHLDPGLFTVILAVLLLQSLKESPHARIRVGKGHGEEVLLILALVVVLSFPFLECERE